MRSVYAAKDLEGMRWKIANELREYRLWLSADDGQTKRGRIMEVV